MEINPIIQALSDLLEDRRQKEALAQRKVEAESEHKHQSDVLKQAGDHFRSSLALQQAQAEQEVLKIRQEIEDRTRAQIAGGLRKVQGDYTLPQKTAQYFMSNLPPGPVPYDLTEEDIAQPRPQFKPSPTQYIESQFGTLPVKDVVTFPELQEEKFKNLRQQMGLDVLKSGLTAEAQEKARRPNIMAQIAGRETVAKDTSASRENIAAAKRISDENIARWRNAALIEAAKLRKAGISATNQASESDLTDSSYMATIGQADLTGNSNAVIKQRGLIRQQGRIPFGTKQRGNLDLDKSARSILDDANAISTQLSTSGGGTLVTGLKSLMPGTDIYNSLKNLQGRAARVAEIYGERGRKSEGDIMRALGVMLSAWITKKQAQGNLTKLQRDFDNNLLNISLRGMPDEQRVENLLLSDFNPESITLQTGNQIIKRYKQVGGIWHVYSPQDKGYVEVTGGK